LGDILVTGANGFVGSHICEALLDTGHNVKALVRKTSDLTNIKDLNLDFVYGDLDNYGSLLDAVDNVDAIVNNAGLTKARNQEEFDRVNIEGTRNILKAALEKSPGIKRFVQISSAAASGPSDTKSPIDESREPRPLTAYGRSKLGGERAVIEAKDKLPVTILRPSAVYGPRDKEMLSFFRMVKFGIKPTFGAGDSYNNFTFVKDLAIATVTTISTDSRSGEVYFVAEKRPYSYSEAGDIIAGTMNRKAINIHIPVWFTRLAGVITDIVNRALDRTSVFSADKVDELAAKYWLLDTSKIENDLGFIAPTSFADGVRETVEWYRSHKWL